uniref:ZP domain-containing protein n=1 Tax=Parascaris univalens TaxID=6257 RepID=A0A914ZGR4_PARUN
SDSPTTPLPPDEITDEHLRDMFASSSSANASDLLHSDTFGKESLIKEIESNRINDESAITGSSTDIDTMHNELSTVSVVLSNATTTAEEAVTGTFLGSAASSHFSESTSSGETNEFTTHISFPSIFSSRFVPSVTPSSTTKDTFILPFVPTTRSSSATASSTTLQQTGTANSQEVPVTLASTSTLITEAPTTYSTENANSAKTTTMTTTSTPSPTTATTIAATSTTTGSTISATTVKPTTTITASTTIATTTATPQTATTSALTKEALTSSSTKSTKESPTR